MKRVHHLARPARLRRSAVALTALVALLASGLLVPIGTAQAATAVPLGTTRDFAILAGSAITNTGASTVVGDVGLHPESAVSGFASVTHDGSLHVADGVALQAKNDLDVAYTDAALQPGATEVPTELGGTTLTPGIYDSAAGTFGLTGALTLDGEGDPNAVFIFQMDSTLTTASGSSVNLINGADLCNVYWQVGSSATLGTNSTFRGTILAEASITVTTGASIEGRLLARSGQVTLDTNTITSAACATPAAEDETEDETEVDDTPTDPTPEDDTPSTDDTPVDDTPTDGTPGDDDAPAEDDTAASGDTPSAGDTPADGATTGQVREVPGGGVAAGGGGVDAATSGGSAWLVAAFLLLAGGTAGILARRRVRA